jgi:signal transduction histidine kinase
MRRYAPAVAVVVAETALLVGSHPHGLPPWVVALYAMAVMLVVALRWRSPAAAFVAALVLASMTGGGFVLLLWSAYQAGYGTASRSGTAVVVGATLGCFGVQLTIRASNPRQLPYLISTFVMFVALPMLVGRYLAQHRRLVAALAGQNRQLRQQRELLAERERLHERLRIARDMHDSLGHRLSLVSVQAAGLETSRLPEPQRWAVVQLATAARGAMTELHELIGALRAEDEPAARSPGVVAIGTLVAEFERAGVLVTLRRRGEPRPLSAAADQAAYRVVEEGLTNAVRHAPGSRVTVDVGWEADALLVTVTNPVPDGPVQPAGTDRHGLSGLRERVRLADGYLGTRSTAGQFRLYAMLPTTLPATVLVDEVPATGRIRSGIIGFAAAGLMFVVVPASMLLGVG